MVALICLVISFCILHVYCVPRRDPGYEWTKLHRECVGQQLQIDHHSGVYLDELALINRN
jgi:hypothetical protein